MQEADTLDFLSKAEYKALECYSQEHLWDKHIKEFIYLFTLVHTALPLKKESFTTLRKIKLIHSTYTTLHRKQTNQINTAKFYFSVYSHGVTVWLKVCQV